MNHELEATLLHLFALYKQVLQILVGSYLQSSKFSNFGLQVLPIICRRTGSNEKAQENQVDESDDEASHLGRSFFWNILLGMLGGIPIIFTCLSKMFDTFWWCFFWVPHSNASKGVCCLQGISKERPKAGQAFKLGLKCLADENRGKSWFERSMDIFMWHFMIDPWETEWKLGILDEFPYQIDLFISGDGWFFLCFRFSVAVPHIAGCLCTHGVQGICHSSVYHCWHS